MDEGFLLTNRHFSSSTSSDPMATPLPALVTVTSLPSCPLPRASSRDLSESQLARLILKSSAAANVEKNRADETMTIQLPGSKYLIHCISGIPLNSDLTKLNEQDGLFIPVWEMPYSRTSLRVA